MRKCWRIERNDGVMAKMKRKLIVVMERKKEKAKMP